MYKVLGQWSVNISCCVIIVNFVTNVFCICFFMAFIMFRGLYSTSPTMESHPDWLAEYIVCHPDCQSGYIFTI